MTWSAPERSPDVAAIYAAAEADRAARPERYALGADVADDIVERATRGADAGLGDRSVWQPGLSAYLDSAQHDGRLNAVGARMVRGAAVAKLRARASIDAHRAQHSDPHATLAPPIVIVGGWRTGTTFLFRLLATDPRLRAPLPVELASPTQMLGLAPADRDARIDASAAAHDGLHLLNPTLATVHDSGARLPEECVLAMGTDFRSWGLSSTTRLDGYTDWLATQDLTGEYARYRAVLGMLDLADGRRWVIKAPAHTAELPTLARTFPGAVIVHLHRDVVETVASGASLFATFRSTYSDHVDAADVGAFQARQTELWFRRAQAFRAQPARDLVTIVDVDYDHLVADPITVLDRIWAAAEIEPHRYPTGLVEAFRAAQPRHGKGVHRYAAQDFGLDPAQLRDQFSGLDPRG